MCVCVCVSESVGNIHTSYPVIDVDRIGRAHKERGVAGGFVEGFGSVPVGLVAVPNHTHTHTHTHTYLITQHRHTHVPNHTT